MIKIAVHSKSFKSDKIPVFKSVLNALQKFGILPVVHSELANFLHKNNLIVESIATFDSYYNLGDVQFLLSIGGDGTLLESITYIREREIPILGINIGRLGFLATIPSNHIEQAISDLINGYFTLDKRSLLSLESDTDIFDGINFGLNEFTIVKRDTSSMIIVHTYIDGEYLNSYWADGLIIATPTGSTGYSLSAGGPVVFPQSSNFIIAPVSPHNLNVRPLIISDNSVISFEIEGRSKNFLVSLDSRSRKVDSTVQLAVKKCDFGINLVKVKEDNFLDTLRRKLNWGYDARN